MRTFSRGVWCAVLMCCCAAGAARAELWSGPFIIEGASIQGDTIYFGCGGRIWSVPANGGEATPLSDTTSYDSLPVVSPNGAQVAFLRRSERVRDVYVRDLAAGEERRLTHHPGNDFAVGWAADSKRVLLNSDREGASCLFTMALDVPLPERLPLPTAYSGSFSGDGKRLAYLPRSHEYFFGEAPFYRGGQLAPLWIVELNSGAVTEITEPTSNVRDPIWVGDRIYFLSDRDGRFDLFVYDLPTRETRKMTDLATAGLRNASGDGHSIVLVTDTGLQIFDLAAETVKPVDVKIPRDDSALRSRVVDAAAQIQSFSLMPDGTKALICARGDVLLVNLESSTASNLTKTPGIAEREAHASPDGRTLAYFSDASGEYALHVRPIDSTQETIIPIEPEPTFYSELTWSPDGKHIAFSDKRLAVWVADLAAGTVRKIDSSTSSAQRLFNLDWSPDGRYLAYAKHGENRLSRIYAYDVNTSVVHPITPNGVSAARPVFDRSGRYLYFLSSPNAALSDFGWSILSGELSEPLVVQQLAAVVLHADDAAPVMGQVPNLAVKWTAVTTAPINFDGIESRIVPIDVSPHLPTELTAGPAGIVYVLAAEWPEMPGGAQLPTQAMYRLDMRSPAQMSKVLPLVDAYAVSPSGNAILTRRDWRLATFQGAKVNVRPSMLGALPVPVVPQDEWKQISHEAWRLMRDLFYDPNHHGLNWQEVEQYYNQFMPGIRSREELNVLMRRMLGRVSVSHLGVGGGDVPTSLNENEKVGLLGADLTIENGLYRIEHVLRVGAFDLVKTQLRAPLDQPGARIADGEYLFAIDDEPIDTTQNIYDALRGKAELPVHLLVGPTPDRAGARRIQVVPLSSETELRLAENAEQNRRYVEEKSQGKLGYFAVPLYSAPGVQDFFRGYFASRTKPGMIIDQRHNGGGITSDYFVELLARAPTYAYLFRDGDDLPVPVNGRSDGTTVLMINEENGSAAETFALMFQLAKLGPIVGMTTYGGVIGPYAPRPVPRLIDGGRVSIPSRAAYTPDGRWVENDGVHPDISVDIMPQDWLAGRDPQLDTAIQAGLDALAKKSPVEVKHPEFPQHP